MKKIIFLLLVIVTLNGCYFEPAMYTHRHSWTRMNHVHRYYTPRFNPTYKNTYRGRSRW